MKFLLSRESLGSIMVSSLEVFNREAAGLVFGFNSGDDIRCTLAFPIQEAKRNENRVDWESSFEKAIEYSEYCILGHRFLGIYHSHDDCAVFSKEDLELFKSNPRYKIFLLINIRKNINNEKLWSDSDGILKACVNGYCIDFICYGKGTDGKISKLPVSSPCMNTFNLFPKEFGIKPSEILLLDESSMEAVQYSLDKIDYNFLRCNIPGKKERSEDNNNYHIEKIKGIVKSKIKRIDKNDKL